MTVATPLRFSANYGHYFPLGSNEVRAEPLKGIVCAPSTDDRDTTMP